MPKCDMNDGQKLQVITAHRAVLSKQVEITTANEALKILDWELQKILSQIAADVTGRGDVPVQFDMEHLTYEYEIPTASVPD